MSFVASSVGESGSLQIAASGAWVAENADAIERELLRLFATPTDATDVLISLKGIEAIDTFGASLVDNLHEEYLCRGLSIKVDGATTQNQPLLEAVSKAMQSVKRVPEPGKSGFLPLAGFAAVWRFVETELSLFFVLSGALLKAGSRLLLNPRDYRLTSTVYQFDRVVWRALPIVLMVIFILGAIIAQQGFFHFRRFGADLYVVDMVGFLMMREIGVLLVAIIIAGRTCSSYTAELGSMKMREEIDALRTMGFDPIEVLVLPRVLVLIIALPVLSFIGSIAGLLGAGLVATTYAGMTADLFFDRLRDAITLDHFLVGLIKAPFIGLVIGIIACVEGLQVAGSTTSLGQRTTKSVVMSIFMIIVLDGLFALFFSAIRM